MGFWSRLFKESAPEGLTLESEYIWEISPPKDHVKVLRHLCDLFPRDHILYLEDGNKKLYKNNFTSRESRYKAHIAQASWPKPHTAHLPLTKDNIDYLIYLLENKEFVEEEIFIHLHVYRDEKVLLQWYDAHDDPIVLSEEIDEGQVDAFCKNIGSTYKKIAMKNT